jgi:hypothetical protein
LKAGTTTAMRWLRNIGNPQWIRGDKAEVRAIVDLGLATKRFR